MNLKYSYLLIIISLTHLCGCALYYMDSEYKGEHFMEKYLESDKKLPTAKHLRNYLKILRKTAYFFFSLKNNTNVNGCLGSFYMKSLLKRTIRDYADILSKKDKKRMQQIIYYGEDIVSHCSYPIKIENKEKISQSSKIMELFINDEPQVYSIEDFNKNKLHKWLQSNITVNFLAKRLDTADITREEFIKIVHFEDNSYLTEPDSDFCLSRIKHNPEPTFFSNLGKCVEDRPCHRIMHSSPSVSYYLSHRLFYLMLLRHTKRCYINSKELDDYHQDILCAFMYREMIYIFRKGLFYRDLFLEHLALCGMLGYQEFHRVHWFNKMAGWQDEQGCVKENFNTYINRTRMEAEFNHEMNVKERNIIKARFDTSCHIHTMSLFVVAMAHGVRYSAYATSQVKSRLASKLQEQTAMDFY